MAVGIRVLVADGVKVAVFVAVGSGVSAGGSVGGGTRVGVAVSNKVGVLVTSSPVASSNGSRIRSSPSKIKNTNSKLRTFLNLSLPDEKYVPAQDYIICKNFSKCI